MPNTRTQQEYIRRIQLALDFIDQNLDKGPQLQAIAEASHFSAYHFHRIFHAMVGETVNDYITRKRMEKAARRLVYSPEISILEVAISGGFSSSANFAKAFKLYFGVSPSELRNHQPEKSLNDTNSKIGKEFKPANLYSQFVTHNRVFDPDKLKELLMKIKVVEMPEKDIAYLSSPKGYELESVYATWEQIINWAENSGLDTGAENKFAICHDNPMITPEDKCRYDAAVVIEPGSNVSSPFKRASIPAGKYAVAYFKDTVEKISSFMTEFCSQWMVNSEYEPDNYPSIFNYLNDSRKDGYVEMNVFIKIKDLQAV